MIIFKNIIKKKEISNIVRELLNFLEEKENRIYYELFKDESLLAKILLYYLIGNELDNLIKEKFRNYWAVRHITTYRNSVLEFSFRLYGTSFVPLLSWPNIIFEIPNFLYIYENPIEKLNKEFEELLDKEIIKKFEGKYIFILFYLKEESKNRNYYFIFHDNPYFHLYIDLFRPAWVKINGIKDKIFFIAGETEEDYIKKEKRDYTIKFSLIELKPYYIRFFPDNIKKFDKKVIKNYLNR